MRKEDDKEKNKKRLGVEMGESGRDGGPGCCRFYHIETAIWLFEKRWWWFSASGRSAGYVKERR